MAIDHNLFSTRGLPKRIIQRILRVVGQYFFVRVNNRKSIYSASKKELAKIEVIEGECFKFLLVGRDANQGGRPPKNK